eukprot:m.209628 g.209628  ORF g.209628 m.209628 type:complete len:262 (-) comp15475_c0_seq3:4605-5390(-)
MLSEHSAACGESEETAESCAACAEPTIASGAVSVVCISDTHGRHAELTIPPGDVLIHAGDFTRFGTRAHAADLNEWAASLPHTHKLVVLGNHEQNAPWVSSVRDILTQWTVLLDESVALDCGDRGTLMVHGTRFAWPVEPGVPLSQASSFSFPSLTDVVVAHGPAKGFVDGGAGCPALLQAIRKVSPSLVVSGHVHAAHGVSSDGPITFANAANVKKGYSIGWEPIVLSVVPKTTMASLAHRAAVESKEGPVEGADGSIEA